MSTEKPNGQNETQNPVGSSEMFGADDAFISLTHDELNFLLWCVGYAEGRAREIRSSTRSEYVLALARADALRNKLMSASGSLPPSHHHCPHCSKTAHRPPRKDE